MRQILYSTAAALLILVALIACTKPQERMLKVTRTALYTITSITVVTNDEQRAQQAIDAAYAELERLGRLLNFYADDSEISAINRNAGIRPVTVSPETFEIVQKAVYTSEMTEGAFDATIGPIVKLWDFRKGIIPDKELLEETLPRVGYKNIVLDKAALSVFLKKSGAQIDLGGIIKGYAADKAAAVLRHHGLTSGIITVGGEIRAFGKKPDGNPWVVGIQNPRQRGANDEVFAVVPVSDKSLSTSGDYIKFFEKDGIRYHHLLNPQTGLPSEKCGSVTVIAHDGVTADGFAKIFILGPEKGLKIAKKLGFDALFIDCNGKIAMTESLQDKIRLQKN